jgi:lipoyl(octanoyl) transferase
MTSERQQSWRLLLDPGLPGSRQMAIDEALYRAVSGATVPVLRLYTWQRPTLSLGYFQKHEVVVDKVFCVRNNIDIVRRLTGGRAVLHDREITYAVAASLESGIFEGRSLQETYHLIAGALNAGLEGLGLDQSSILLESTPAATAAEAPESRLPQCFVTVSRYEISRHSKKIIGSAQKRSRDRFLQHGSILLDFDIRLQQGCVRLPAADIESRIAPLNRLLGRQLSFDEIARSLTSAFASTFDVRMVADPLTGEELREVDLLEEKYKSPEWTERATCR